MLLLIALTLVDFASSFRTERKCYGDSYDVPIYYTPPLFEESIYYRPRKEERILVVSKGKSNHKRFQVGAGRIHLKYLTEQDNGAKLYFGVKDGVTLEVSDCQEPQSVKYGDLFSWRVPFGADYLEFSQISPEGHALKPYVMWNRTNPSAGRGTVKRNYYELTGLKQKDSGYYRFMEANGNIIKWKRLKVEEYSRHDRYHWGENFEMDFPLKLPSLRIVFIPRDGINEESEIYDHHRMDITESYFSFYDLKYEDSGIYKFVDDEGFLVLIMELIVDDSQISTWDYITGAPGWVYAVAFAIIVLCAVCCCCVRKCCCKKSSNKRNSPATEAAAPVYHHDTTQPTQPVVPLLHREPRVITKDPPAYNSVADNMDHTQLSQVTVPEGLGQTSTAGVPASSDFEPRFEFKGSVFPSAPPLSSGTSIQDVYSSDKLNFL